MPNLLRHERKSRQDWLNTATDRMAKDFDREELKKAKAAGEVPEKTLLKDFFSTVPNRTVLRRGKLNMARLSGKGHARCSHAKKTPASLYTLIAIHQTLPNGTVRKIVVPRDRFEGK